MDYMLYALLCALFAGFRRAERGIPLQLALDSTVPDTNSCWQRAARRGVNGVYIVGFVVFDGLVVTVARSMKL